MNDLEHLIAGLLNTSHTKEFVMTVTIRRVEQSDHEYFAYVKSICGKATYFLYFSDDIGGAIVLHNFLEMLRRYFQKDEVEVKLQDATIQLKNAYLLSIFREAQVMEKPSA
jgi:hypothetical protein